MSVKEDVKIAIMKAPYSDVLGLKKSTLDAILLTNRAIRSAWLFLAMHASAVFACVLSLREIGSRTFWGFIFCALLASNSIYLFKQIFKICEGERCLKYDLELLAIIYLREREEENGR